MSEFLQFLFSGLTVGAVYALIALGFVIIYNASDVVNFAQGEFVMIGGMVTASLYSTGVPLLIAMIAALLVAALVGFLLNRFALEPARGASVVSLIIITIGASIFLRGLVSVLIDKQVHRYPAFSGEEPLQFMGAAILPQSLWVIGGAIIIFIALYLFFNRSLTGKSVLAVADNRLAARLMGINVRFVMTLSFALSAAAGAAAGILVTPITLVRYDIGVMLALKGFSAAMLGGMGNAQGALLGGFILGLIEAFTAGYISSDYKDAMAFIVILLVLFVMPNGLFGRPQVERV